MASHPISSLSVPQRENLQIRIKQRLSETSIYSDNVLPEYIMVMLQNKKSSEQIIKDLHPFLGPDGSRGFVSWLWSAIQEVSSSDRLISEGSAAVAVRRGEEKPKTGIRPHESARKTTTSSDTVDRARRTASRSRSRSRARVRSRSSDRKPSPRRSDRSRSRSKSRERKNSSERRRSRSPRRRNTSQSRSIPDRDVSPAGHNRIRSDSKSRNKTSSQVPRARSREPRIAPAPDRPASDPFDFIMIKDEPDAEDAGPKRKRQDAVDPAVPIPQPKRRSILERLSSAPISHNPASSLEAHSEPSSDESPVQFTLVFDQLEEYENRGGTQSGSTNSTFRYFTNGPAQSSQHRAPPQSLILCKFYPFCMSLSCPYLHPQEVCVHFPECPFGKKCRFLHPPELCPDANHCTKEHCVRIHPPKPPVPCKRGFACNKDSCSFLHPQEKCHFGAGCQNPLCQYSHSKDCRYGLKCYIPGCKFAHSLKAVNSISAPDPDVSSAHPDGVGSLVVQPDEESDNIL